MEEPVTSTAEQNPAVTKKNIPVRLIILGVIGVLILVIAVALAFVRIGGYTLFDRVGATAELRGIMIGERSFETVTPRTFGLTELLPKNIEVSGTLGDYAAAGGTEAAIVRQADTGVTEVQLLGKEQRILASSPAAKAAVAVSHDGSFVAYAARTDGTPGFAPALSSWTVHLVDVSSGSDIELGTGFDPEFFVRDGVPYLLFTSAEGLVVNSLAQRDTFSGFITALELSDTVDHAAKISSDGSYLALKDPATRQHTIYSVYRVAINLPLGIEPNMHPANRYTDIIFADGVAYGIDNSVQGSATVWKIDLSGSTAESRRYTFSTEFPNRFLR